MVAYFMITENENVVPRQDNVGFTYSRGGLENHMRIIHKSIV